MAQQVEGFVFLDVVSLLEHGDVVRTAFMEIAVLVGVDGVDFSPTMRKYFRASLQASPM